MKNTILILIALLFLTGCEKEVSSLQDRGGVKYEFNSETPFTGKYVEYYKDGQKKFEEHLTLGKRHGLLTQWWGNGQKMQELNVKNGMNDGLFTSWYENGQKKEEVTWKGGRRTGLWTWWEPNGKKFEEMITGSQLEESQKLAREWVREYQ